MNKFTFAIVGMLIFPALLFAQTTVKVASDNPPAVGNLNTAIQAAIDGGTLTNTVFELEAAGYYVLTGTINVPAGQTLTIVAPEPGTTQLTSPPQILWVTTTSIDKTFMFNCVGDIKLKNIWLYFATTAGDQVGSCICLQDDPTSTARRITLEGVILDYCPIAYGGGSVNIACKHFIGNFINCYWRNNTDPHFMYYGRALSFPFSTSGWHADSVTFENCTFANMGYVLMEEGDEYYDNVKINHCTFLDVNMYALEYGWWYKISVNNSIFQNTYALGQVPSQTGTGDPQGATVRIDSVERFGFTVPFTNADRHVLFTHSSHNLDPWLVDWMGYGPNGNPYSKDKHRNRLDDDIPIPQPMVSPQTLSAFFDLVDGNGKKVYPYLNKANLDTTNPLFIAPPTDTAKYKAFLLKKWTDNTDSNWAWRPENALNMVWPLEENLAYTNQTMKTAGMGGFPLGDLYHWWPTEYKAWKAQAATENARITTWLTTGKDGGTGVQSVAGNPETYELAQNYPNPFNPETQIKYSIPEKANVTLKVYNILGLEIATLFNGAQQAGNYTATFNGKNLASGVYFYRLQAGNVSLTKKLMLMK
jgi:hypothetical protein